MSKPRSPATVERAAKIIDLMGRGMTQVAIADQLGITKQAVNTYWKKWKAEIYGQYTRKAAQLFAEMVAHRQWQRSTLIEIVSNPKTPTDERIKALAVADKVATSLERLCGFTTAGPGAVSISETTVNLNAVPAGLIESLDRALSRADDARKEAP
jgi:predicted transcriptional regulator